MKALILNSMYFINWEQCNQHFMYYKVIMIPEILHRLNKNKVSVEWYRLHVSHTMQSDSPKLVVIHRSAWALILYMCFCSQCCVQPATSCVCMLSPSVWCEWVCGTVEEQFSYILLPLTKWLSTKSCCLWETITSC